MFATVVHPVNRNKLPSMYGPYYSLDSALQAVVPTGDDRAIVYDLDKPNDDLFERAGIIFSSGRKHVREEYRSDFNGSQT